MRRRSVAQPGSASGLGPEGREFESLHSDHFPFIHEHRASSNSVCSVGSSLVATNFQFEFVGLFVPD